MPESLIPKHGGYRKLKSFQVAELVETMMTAASSQLTTHGRRLTATERGGDTSE
jgi:hypothetical protein